MVLAKHLLAVIEQEKPEAIVFGHTALGKDLSPKIASKLQIWISFRCNGY